LREREIESPWRAPRVDRFSRCDLAAVTRRRPGIRRAAGIARRPAGYGTRTPRARRPG